jgi:hypothetical protein
LHLFVFAWKVGLVGEGDDGDGLVVFWVFLVDLELGLIFSSANGS